MARTMHLAIFMCDTPVNTVRDSVGTYGDIFEHRLLLAMKHSKNADFQLRISKWDVVSSSTFPDLEEVDAILLSGSKHTAFHDDPWILSLVEYVSRAIDRPSISVFGFCFGHQIIARALGARVGVSTGGWEISVCEVELSETGQQLFGKNSLELHQMHRDDVQSLPHGVVSLGHSPSCTIQGMYRPGKILTTQSHPEFNSFIMEEIVQTRHRQKIFNDELATEGSKRAGKPHDGLLVFAAVLDIMQGQTIERT